MTRSRAHTTAIIAFTCVAAAIIAGPPTAPLWVRWAGVVLAVPAILAFVVTAPRTPRSTNNNNDNKGTR